MIEVILIATIAVLSIAVGVLICTVMSRINDLDADNTGSETGIEQDRNINSFEGWK